MELVLEDLAQHGLWLIGPGSSHFDQWLAEILHLGQDRGRDWRDSSSRGIDYESERQGSAILVNGSGRDIAEIAFHWRFQRKDLIQSTRIGGLGMGMVPGLLLPFGLGETELAGLRDRFSIKAGSKRYVVAGRILGDNSDVAPAPTSGWIGSVTSEGRVDRHPMDWSVIRSTTLSLDGVFFVDGGFVGPDQAGLWAKTTGAARIHTEMARLAFEGRARGDSAEMIFARLSEATSAPVDPLSPPPPSSPHIRIGFEAPARPESIEAAHRVAMMRQYYGDEATLDRLASWHGTVLPHFRRL
ncbi:MAG: hypothetical protein J0H49_19105 [Acidobacteria bacterium]|nr:hypothetical protein [Acidobacteriota bacterium]